MFADCGYGPTLDMTTTGNNGDEVFSGTASATANENVWKVAVAETMTNYMRDMYQCSTDTQTTCTTATTGVAQAGLNDTITVNDSGGPGVYNINYIFSLNGSLASSNNSLFNAQFCTDVFMPQGVGTATSSCLSPSQTVPSTVTLTYSQLSFGAPITPTIDILALLNLAPIPHSQVGGSNDTVFSANANVSFGDTIQLTSVLITDSNGAPIPGVTINSQAGVNYPLDPANVAAIPEPATAAELGAALALSGLWIGTRRPRNT
jgi:hypothetical protein